MPDVLVVMVAYENLSLTQQAYASVLASEHPVHLVIWDNHSSDGTAEWLRSIHHSSTVDVVCSGENILWSPAINRGIQQFWSGEPYVGWMNNDVLISPLTIDRLLRHLQKHPRLGLVGPMGSAMGGQQDYATWYGPWTDTWMDGSVPVQDYSWERDLYAAISGRPLRKTSSLCGAFLLTRYSVLEEVGFLDEGCALSCDDYEFSLRLQAHGYWLAAAADTYIHHFGHQTGGAPEWDENMEKGWVQLREKWGSFVEANPPNQLLGLI